MDKVDRKHIPGNRHQVTGLGFQTGKIRIRQPNRKDPYGCCIPLWDQAESRESRDCCLSPDA